MRVHVLLVSVAVAVGPAMRSMSQERFAVDARAVELAVSDAPGLEAFLQILPGQAEVAGVRVSNHEVTRFQRHRTTSVRTQGLIVAHSVSATGQFVAWLARVDEGVDSRVRLALEVADSDFDVRYRVEINHNGDDPIPGIHVGDDGSVVIVYHETGRVEFVAPEGGVVARHTLSDGLHDVERIVLVGISREGRTVAIAINEPVSGGGMSVATDRVWLFSAAGVDLGSVEVPHRTASSLAVSPSGDVLVVGLQDVAEGRFETLFLRPSGDVLLRTDFAAERIEFDAPGRTVAVADKRRLAVVEPASGEELLQYRVADSSQRLQGIAASATGNYFVGVSTRTRFEDGQFVHDDITVHEFVRSAGGPFGFKAVALGLQARSVRVSTEDPGVAISLDGTTLWMERPR